ncbi:MAG: DUF349 domain-containing protein [Flavobacteriaceae bacterium]
MLDENKDNLNEELSANEQENNAEETKNITEKTEEEAPKEDSKKSDEFSDHNDIHEDDEEEDSADDDEGDDVSDNTGYGSLSLEQLVSELQRLLKNESIPTIRNKVEKIRYAFNDKFSDILKEKKEEFIEEGGNEIDFHYSNPTKSAFNDLLFEYKTKRELYYKAIEEDQKQNLEKRLKLIDELKDLIDNAEPSSMYGQFKELQEKWKGIGKIPRTKYNDTWRTYHHHVERFYDLLHLSNDFRDLDFKHNYDEKLKLVEKAEALVDDNDLPKAFKELQILHKMWKEDIGPVAREHREEVWERFSEATKKIHERRHELQKQLDERYEENAVKKREIIAKIEALVKDRQNESHKYWQKKIDELEKLRQEFFAMGRVPKAINEDIWQEFKTATRDFNRVKNNFYKNIKKDQQTNLEKKTALVAKAEEYKNSEDWEVATDIMKQIQAEWKTIGHVPRKYSDKIWKQFKDACNHFFDRLHNVQDEANKEQIDAFNKKKELLENLKSQADTNETLSIEVIDEYVKDWQKLGRLPHNMSHLEGKFNKVLQGLYSKLDMGDKEIAMLKFKNIIGNYLASRNYRKIDNEQLFVRKKIDEITREIQQLENNISFISNADDDNPILKNVHRNIDNYNDQLEIWKLKLDYLTNLEY